jgi:hypothetical protein
MKKLNFEEMEKIEGGIACIEIDAVFDWLEIHNPGQYQDLLGVGIQCYASDGRIGTYYRVW